MSILLAMAILVNPLTAIAQGTEVEVGSAKIAVGQSIQLPIVVKNLTDARGLGAYHFRIDFDQQKIRVDEVLGGDPPFDTAVANIADDHVEIASFHAQIPGPTGDITVSKLAITAMTTGNCPLTITIYPGEFINTDGIPIAANGINGTITVTKEAPGEITPPPPAGEEPSPPAEGEPSPPAEGAPTSPGEGEVPAKEINWWLIGIIIAAVIVVGGLVGFVARRR